MKYSINCSVFRLTDANKGEVDPKTNQPLPQDLVELLTDRYNIDVNLPEKSTADVIVSKAKEWMALSSAPTKEALKDGKTVLPLDGKDVVAKRSLSYEIVLPLIP